jgi:hypothetical protein
MPSRYNLPHISIDRFRSENSYQGEGTNIYKVDRVREDHARRIQGELVTAFARADQERPADARLPEINGVYLEVELRGKTPTDILDLTKSHIRSGASKTTEDNNRTIAVYVPDYARKVLEKILEDYRTGPLGVSGDPPQKDRVESIEAIRKARLETFWTDNADALPKQAQDEIWWALWCHRKYEQSVEEICARLELRVADKDRRLFFPEITVVPVLATRAAIELMLFATEGIAELRRASDNPFFFTDTVKGDEHPWVERLAERVTWPGNEAPAVCLFDTGVNRGHALIEPALSPDDTRAVNMEWGGDDQNPEGHGTGMAGLILHGDLTAALSDDSERVLRHRLESVKLLPPNGLPRTDPKTYGTITQAAVAVPEIQAPGRSASFAWQ